jgi:DNA-binding NarL/FixJ family response regulator
MRQRTRDLTLRCMRTAVVVDDHAAFRVQACRLLASAGYEVIGDAADGAGALRVTRAARPDFVLVDVELPDMSGFDVVHQLNGDAPGPTALVLVSSREATTYGGRIDDCGATGFIWKGELSAAALAAIVGEPS